MLAKLFTQHTQDINETYSEHAGHALYIGLRMLGAGCACLVHALIPGLFIRTASSAVGDIQDLMTSRTAEPQLDERTARHGA